MISSIDYCVTSTLVNGKIVEGPLQSIQATMSANYNNTWIDPLKLTLLGTTTGGICYTWNITPGQQIEQIGVQYDTSSNYPVQYQAFISNKNYMTIGNSSPTNELATFTPSANRRIVGFWASQSNSLILNNFGVVNQNTSCSTNPGLLPAGVLPPALPFVPPPPAPS